MPSGTGIDPNYVSQVHAVFEAVRRAADASLPDLDRTEEAIASGRALTPDETRTWWDAQRILLQNGSEDEQQLLYELRVAHQSLISLTGTRDSIAVIHPLFAPETPRTGRRTYTLLAFDIESNPIIADAMFNVSDNETVIRTFPDSHFDVRFEGEDVMGFVQGDMYWFIANPDQMLDTDQIDRFVSNSPNEIIAGRWASTLLTRHVLEAIGLLEPRATLFNRVRFEIDERERNTLSFLSPDRYFSGLGVSLRQDDGLEFLFRNDLPPRLNRYVPRQKLDEIFANVRFIAEILKEYGLFVERGDWLAMSYDPATGAVRLDITTDAVILDARRLGRAVNSRQRTVRPEFYLPDSSVIVTSDEGVEVSRNTLQQIMDLLARVTRTPPPSDDVIARSALQEFERFIRSRGGRLQLADADRPIVFDIFKYYNRILETAGISHFISYTLYPLLIKNDRSQWLGIAKGLIDEAKEKLVLGNIDGHWVQVAARIWGLASRNSGSSGSGNSGNAAGGESGDGAGGIGGSSTSHGASWASALPEMNRSSLEYNLAGWQGIQSGSEGTIVGPTAAEQSRLIYMNTLRPAEAVVEIAP